MQLLGFKYAPAYGEACASLSTPSAGSSSMVKVVIMSDSMFA